MKTNQIVVSTKDFVASLLDWFSPGKYLSEDTFVSRLRSYQITAFVVFFINALLNFISFLTFSYIITAISCLQLILIRFLIDRGKILTAYTALLLSLNVALFLLVYVEGTRSGVYLFFFPCIISFSFLAEFTNKSNTRLTYLICVGFFIAAIVLAPNEGHFQKFTDSQYQQNFFLNVFLSFAITGWMAFSLANENNKRQKELRNKEVFLNTIFNSSLYAELIVDMSNGLISNYNNQTSPLFSLAEKKALMNTPACNLFTELDGGDHHELYKQMCNPDANWEGELTCRRLDGTVFPASVRMASFGYNGKSYKKLTIIDISEKKLILDELEMAKNRAEHSTKAKSQFLSHMSHELRTPLNGIIGATNLLLQDEYLPSQNEQLNILKFSSEHMLSLINDVLDLSKLDADKIKLEKITVDIDKFINTVASPFIHQFSDKDVEFLVEVSPDIRRPVLADPTRLNQVLTNLISNAYKFTSAGQVKLQVNAVEIKSETYELEFSVSDTGIGISEDKQRTIFDQFTQADVKTTRKYGGTGLGLTISQKLVNLMGGKLGVESKYNKGSRFYFRITLPVYWGKEKVYVNNKIKDTSFLNGLRVLIAEDNPVNMMIATRFLDKWGVKYVKAKNGNEAVMQFRIKEFDLILMDLEMPEMDGYTAIQEIRKVNTHIPAMAFTAAVFDDMQKKLTDNGFNDFIQKPFRPEDLFAKLVKYSPGLAKSA